MTLPFVPHDQPVPHHAPPPSGGERRPGAAPLLELRGVGRSWRAGTGGCSATVRALAGVDLAVGAGELVAVAGGAGAGKTTLMLCAAGLARPDAGTVGGAAVGRVAYVGPGDDAWVRRAMAAMERGARALLLDVLDGRAHASPRAVAALAGSAAGAGLAVLVAARDVGALPAFASRVVVLVGGRIVARLRPGDALAAAPRAAGGARVARGGSAFVAACRPTA